jgi:hypothetical protein
MAYTTILTKIGQAKITDAINNGTKINITKVILGDGGGSDVTPTENQTALVNKVAEVAASYATIEDSSFVIKGIVPANVGGFTIREKGLVDEDGDLIAVGNYPATYKPTSEEGDTKEIQMNFYIAISNSSAITVNPIDSSVYATKGEVKVVDDKINTNVELILGKMASIVNSAFNNNGVVGLSQFNEVEGIDNKIHIDPQPIIIDGEIFELGGQDVDIGYPTDNKLFEVTKLWATKDGYVVSEVQPPNSIPIFNITRFNKYAYDPTYNPFGTMCYSDGKDWWETSKVRSETTVISEVGTSSGRPDFFRYDRVYDCMVEDVRMNAIAYDESAILEDATKGAIFAEIRGKEKLGKIKVMQLDTSDSSTSNNRNSGKYLWIGSSMFYLSALLGNGSKHISNGHPVDLSKRVFVIDYLNSDGTLVGQGIPIENGWSNEITDDNGRTSDTVACRVRRYDYTLADETSLNGVTTFRELIGNHAKTNEEFYALLHEVNEYGDDSDNGSYNCFANGSRTNWKLQRKAEQVYEILTSPDGVAWSKNTDWTLDTITNEVKFTTAPSAGTMIFVTYKGYSNIAEDYYSYGDEPNFRVHQVGSGIVAYGNYASLGNVLVQSLIDKVGDTANTGGQNSLYYRFVINSYATHSGAVNYRLGLSEIDNWARQLQHDTVTTNPSGVNNIVKAVAVLMSYNGRYYLGLPYTQDAYTPFLEVVKRTETASDGKKHGIAVVPLPYMVGR